MRFFTRAWTQGELTDEAFEAVPEAYRRHLGALGLPASVVVLAESNLHDALVLDVEDEPKRLRLRLRVGDHQRGYSDLRITYTGATTDSATLAALRAHEAEVLYSEIDRTGGRYAHRLLLWPAGEAVIAFEDVKLVSRAVASRSAL